MYIIRTLYTCFGKSSWHPPCANSHINPLLSSKCHGVCVCVHMHVCV